MPAPHTLRLLLLVATVSCAAQNNSSPVWTDSVPSSRDVVVREGSSALIQCNVTGSRDDVKWYNSKGRLLGEGGGNDPATLQSLNG